MGDPYSGIAKPTQADPYAGIAKPAGRPATPRKPGVLDRINQGLANFNKGVPFAEDLTSAVTAATRSPVDAAKVAANTLLRTYPGANPMAPPVFPEAQQRFSGQQQAVKDANRGLADQLRDTPVGNVAADLSQGMGMAGSAVLPGPKGANLAIRPVTAPTLGGKAVQIGGNAARGATAAGTTGAGYGLGFGDAPEERLNSANAALGPSAFLGGMIPTAPQVWGAVKPGPRPIPSPTSQAGKAATLEQAGVSLLPGQKAGGLVKSFEDFGRRMPIVGPAIRGAGRRSEVSLNRAVANTALAQIGEGVPKNVETGFDSVAHVAKRLGAKYDSIGDMVQRVDLDNDFAARMQERVAPRIGDLSESGARDFERILTDRMTRLSSGISGRDALGIKQELGELAADAMSSTDRSDRLMGRMLMDVSDEISALIGRQSPEAAQMLDQADAGWAIYTRLRNAASKGTDGNFTPSQLRTAVRMEDASVGKGRVAKGEAILQDLSNASTIMPDQYGNPGTADAGAILGLGALWGKAPPVGAAVTGGLAAAATPYMMMGRKVLDSLPVNASGDDVARAAQELRALTAQDPKVAELLQMLSIRFGQTAGATAAALNAQ